jgi:hypothetical protein
MPVTIAGKKIMAMSYYPREAYHLYRKYSTKAVAHTLKTYSDFSIPYPYPVAISVEASSGMEYPMICFNFGRTNKDGTYSEDVKYGMLGVIIHEVGHNFYPMIINSDERQWSWLDEGLNSFVQTLAQETFDPKFPSRRGPAFMITDYMKLPKDQLEPIMTNSENIIQFGNNAYGKPAIGLNILRETIMGRKLFDYAFKEYARRWAFKHPTPADFFRTMEDASAEDLDWFWRGWFYTTDPVDISLDSVKYAKANTDAAIPEDMREVSGYARIAGPQEVHDYISKQRNRADTSIKYYTDQDTSLRDFYWHYQRGLVKIDTTPVPLTIDAKAEPMDAATKQALADKHFYELNFTNKGGMPMPVIIEWTYTDGSKEIEKIPAQVWRHNERSLVKTFMKNKEVASIKLDPLRETADIDESNNTWGAANVSPNRFEVFKSKAAGRGQSVGPNPMQKAEGKKTL